jgi:EAL domain-containing protein (putative c-di-GMP-specific phosphodiesterase class I)
LPQYLTRLHSQIATSFIIENHELHVLVSIGASHFPKDGDRTDLLLKNAHVAVEHAKNLGVNHYELFTKEMRISPNKKLLLEHDIQKALKRNEFILYYQPQWDIQANKMMGMEALLRWQHPELGLINPDEFTPLSEETGLIIQIEQWVLRHGCEQTKYWLDENHVPLQININLSAKEFARPGLVTLIEDVLDRSGLPPHLLELEVTESFVMHDIKLAGKILHSLHELGVRLALDDFGTGYSSLSYLMHLPFDSVKIDKSFCQTLFESKKAQIILLAMIHLCQDLGFSVVVEGVETTEQLQFLRSHQCYLAQGYLFSKPLSAADFLNYCHEQNKNMGSH